MSAAERFEAALARLAHLPQTRAGDAVLLQGSCLDILPEIPGVADLVVTDPPYKLSSGGNATQVMGGLFSHANYDNKGLLMDVVGWSEIGGPIFRACVENADAYVMANDKNVFQAQHGLTGAGWRFHNLLVWDKGVPTRNRWYMKEAEYTLYLWKGTAQTIRNPGSGQIFRCPRPRGDEKIHATQKPVALMAHYIGNSSDPGDIVLDPFAGSASTLVAAIETGRRAIGIESDPENFAAAAERLAAMTAETREEAG